MMYEARCDTVEAVAVPPLMGECLVAVVVGNRAHLIPEETFKVLFREVECPAGNMDEQPGEYKMGIRYSAKSPVVPEPARTAQVRKRMPAPQAQHDAPKDQVVGPRPKVQRLPASGTIGAQILSAIKDGGLTAAQIHDYVNGIRGDDDQIERATIYTTLNYLKTKGLVENEAGVWSRA